MRKIVLALITSVLLLILNGCGGILFFDESMETYYLQSYDSDHDRYEGVQNLYYECGDDTVGYTNAQGAFHFYEGDSCFFYDLDETVSYAYGRLYISDTPSGSVAVGEVVYRCASGWHGVTNEEGLILFDPDYVDSESDGDRCQLYL